MGLSEHVKLHVSAKIMEKIKIGKRDGTSDLCRPLLQMWHLPVCPAGALWPGAVLNDTTSFFLVDAGRKLELLM